jgi:hypothetical protein
MLTPYDHKCSQTMTVLECKQSGKDNQWLKFKCYNVIQEYENHPYGMWKSTSIDK